MKKLEGCKERVYQDVLGNPTVGIGFNLHSPGAKDLWTKAGIPEKFEDVMTGRATLHNDSIEKLFKESWEWCKARAEARSLNLDLDYYSMPAYKQFILADIVYNTGSVTKWKKVFMNTDIEGVIFEARRKPYAILDGRVAKIAKHFGIIDTVADAKDLGLVYTKHVS